LIPTDGDGMYRQFLADEKAINPRVRVVGFTATPFRLGSGPICSPDHFLNSVCYEIGIRELIGGGYLCPLVSKAGAIRVDTSTLHVRNGEFVAEEVENLMDRDSLVNAACQEIVAYTKERHACLIFAAGVKHGRHIVRVLKQQHGIECGFVCGDTPARERDEILARFRNVQTGHLFDREPLKYLCNVNVLTTGFDAPNVDCVVLLRPTHSCGLYLQAVGRGFRQHPEKLDTLILDFGNNIVRHGPVDQLKIHDRTTGGSQPAPAKECPKCHSVIATGYTVCPDCGHEFPPPDRQQHEATASNAGILSGQVSDAEYEVLDVAYAVHTKRGADENSPRSMRVDYRLALNCWQSEWVCFEHAGYARRKAEAWWRKRSPDPVPDTAERAVEIAEAGGVCATEKITIRHVAGERFDRIVKYELGPMPEPATVTSSFDPAEIPF
jgi:DNA repair protein RadD